MKTTACHPVFVQNVQGLQKVQETLARESKLQLTIEGQKGCSFLTCSPGQERHLVLGRLRSAKLISDASQVQEISITRTDEKNVSVHVVLHQGEAQKQEKQKDITLHGAVIFQCARELEKRQVLFPQTGCAHGAALFDQQGHLLAMAEDVARHSALEKAIGQALEEKTLEQAVLAVMTSRLNEKLVTCAATAGLTFLCGMSVGTFSALQAAQKHNLTLIGRVRGQGMNIYTGHTRLVWENEKEQNFYGK